MFELRHTFLQADQRDRWRALANRFAGMGATRLRCDSPRWPEVEPEPGSYKWDTLDQLVDAVTTAGLTLYYNPVDIPAHALGYYDDDGNWRDHPWEGYRTYFPSGSAQLLPTCWNPGTGVFAPAYLTSISSECANPPRVNKASAFRFGAALGARYGSRIARYGVPLNESDSAIFFPLFILTGTKYNGDWGPVTKMTYDDVCAPFAKGVRSTFPGAVIEGCESATYGYLATMLAHEKELGDHTFDAISTHGYAGELGPNSHFPDDAVKRITMKEGGLLQYLIDSGAWNNRPWGIGEVAPEAGDDPYSILDYVPVMRHLGASWITLMMGDAFFKPGTFANGIYEPNDLYDQVGRAMNRQTIKHQAVAH